MSKVRQLGFAVVLTVVLFCRSAACAAVPKPSPTLSGAYLGTGRVVDYQTGATAHKFTSKVVVNIVGAGGNAYQYTLNVGNSDGSTTQYPLNGFSGNFHLEAQGAVQDPDTQVVSDILTVGSCSVAGDQIAATALVYRDGFIRTISYKVKRPKIVIAARAVRVRPPSAPSPDLLPALIPTGTYTVTGKAMGLSVDVTSLAKPAKFVQTIDGTVTESQFTADLTFDMGGPAEQAYLDCGRYTAGEAVLFYGPNTTPQALLMFGIENVKAKTIKGTGYLTSSTNLTTFTFALKVPKTP